MTLRLPYILLPLMFASAAVAQPPRGAGRVSAVEQAAEVSPAASAAPEAESAAPPQPDVVHLTNGNAVKGYVESATATDVVLVSEVRRGSFTRARFRREQVARIEYAPEAARAAMAARVAWWEGKAGRDAFAASEFEVTRSTVYPGAWEAQGPYFHIICDVDAAETRELAFRLNTMYEHWLALFRRDARGAPPTQMFVVTHAGAYRSHLERMGAPPSIAAMSSGIYLPPPTDVSLIPLHLNDPAAMRAQMHAIEQRHGSQLDGAAWDRERRRINSALASQRALQISTAYHEAMHAFMAKELFPERSAVPVWLHEGMAEYVEMLREGMHGLRTEAVHPFAHPVVEAAARNGSLPNIRHVVERQSSITTHDTGGSARMFYAASWALVYYLNLERGALENDMYARYVTALERHADPVAAFEAMSGEPVEETEKAWKRAIPRWR